MHDYIELVRDSSCGCTVIRFVVRIQDVRPESRMRGFEDSAGFKKPGEICDLSELRRTIASVCKKKNATEK